MSRKWQRMVEKNSKQVNRSRSKSGLKPISESAKSGEHIIYGRSIIFPAFLLLTVTFFMVVYGPYAEQNALYWVTLCAYFFLAVIYFLRRPFLKISQNTLSTRKMGRDRHVTPSEIEGIIVGKNHVSIPLKGKKAAWFFSRTMNLYPIEEMTEQLRKYAEKHQISFLREEKK